METRNRVNKKIEASVLKAISDEGVPKHILKVDIETLEEAVVNDIPVDLARNINKIYVEFVFPTNPLAETHTLSQYGDIAQFTRRTS